MITSKRSRRTSELLSQILLAGRVIVLVTCCCGNVRSATLESFLGPEVYSVRPMWTGTGATSLVTAQNGSILAFRNSNSQQLYRSTDGGQTWNPAQQLSAQTISGSAVVNEINGEVLYLNLAQSIRYRSTNHGVTWSQQSFQRTPDLYGFPNAQLGSCNAGITLTHGDFAGRLILPIRTLGPNGTDSQSQRLGHYASSIYSDDAGATWITSKPFPVMGTAEGAITELFHGGLIFTAREQISLGGRYFATSPSSNGGDIWLYKDRMATLPDGPRGSPFGNVGSLIRVPIDGLDVLLYSNVDSDGGGMPSNLGGSNTAGREKLTVWASFDGGLTWPIKRLVYQGPAGASHLAVGREATASAGKVYLLFEGGPAGWNSATHLATFNLTWLLAGTNPYDYLVWLNTIFWTGHNDRWGGGSEATQKYGWSAVDFQSPLFPLYALMDANGVSDGDAYHFVYDRQQMLGGNSTVRMNRNNVTMHSVTLRGLGHTGFTFGNNDSSGQGIVLGANLTVQGGTHSFLPPPITYSNRKITLAGDSHWDIDQNGSLYFLHSLAGPYSLYKSGAGMLRMTGVQQHTATTISDGTFGPGSGDLSLDGSLSIGPLAKLFFLPGFKIQVASNVSIQGEFGIQRLVNLLPETPPGIYPLIEGSVSKDNVVNLGPAAAVPIAPGKIAYFENSPGLVLRVEMIASSQVLAAHVYHAGFSGAGLPPWNALDLNKTLARETGSPQTLDYHHLINSKHGINGLLFIIDRQSNQSALTVNDFVFQMSPQSAFNTTEHPPADWVPVPVMPSVDVNPSEPQEVLIQWPDQTLMNRWLRVTVKANSNTGLLQPQVYYIGHLLGETTGSVENGVFSVSFATEVVPIRSAMATIADASSTVDIDKNGLVQFADIIAMRTNAAQQLSQITIPN